MEQQIRYCKTPDNVRIAYAAAGKGPPLVRTAHWLTHLQYDLESPVWLPWIEEFSKTHTYIRYDERGCGLSDWNPEDFSFDAWVRDLETVVDTIGLERFALLGLSQGGSVSVAYAAKHPERVSKLILAGAYAKGWNKRGLDTESLEQIKAMMTIMKTGWGKDNPAARRAFTANFIPDSNLEQMHWFDDLQRLSTSPGNALRFMQVFGEIDVSGLAPRVSAPTLVVHLRQDNAVPFQNGMELASLIPNAHFVPLEGSNHIFLSGDEAWSRFLSEVKKFLGIPEGITPEPPAPPDLGIGGWLKGSKKRH